MHININKPLSPGSVKGFTLIELMISMVIMLVVALATIQISSSVFRTNTESVQMIQMSQEMRSAIQLISRDIRRAGYNDDSLAGFLSSQAISSGITMGTLDANGIANCLQVRYDDLDGIAKNAVYRLRVVSTIGRVSAHFGATASCDTPTTDTGWVDISDPILTHITGLEFILDDSRTDIAENMSTGNTIQVGVEQISISISAALRSSANASVNRTISNAVQIRNQYLSV
jgi:prepilin-type N-terminal cleavage/methylation domain-containing protein